MASGRAAAAAIATSINDYVDEIVCVDPSLIRAAERLDLHAKGEDSGVADWIGDVIWHLDEGLRNTYDTARRQVFQGTFDKLESLADGEPGEIPQAFDIMEPRAMQTSRPVLEATRELSLEEFNQHLFDHGTPLLIPDVTSYWPASTSWQDPGYWLRITIGGRRIVPVEIGSYVDEDYVEQRMSFGKYLFWYVMPESTEKRAYLAQHQLIDQIPALRDDIVVPEYCYTVPPPPRPYSAAAMTPGLDKAATDLEEPFMNVWFGPRGTKTPLHTDPYHNILAQVVGYKYVRLYAPDQRHLLYPGTTSSSGLDISNTSLIDMAAITPLKSNDGTSKDGGRSMDRRRIEFMKKWPLAIQAVYQESILSPGECLYIPLGWWHYVESLSVSVSVNFWWN